MTVEDALKSLLGSGPGYALVAAVLFIARQIWYWLWDQTIDPQTGEKKGPAAQWLLEYKLTQQEMRQSIKTTAEGVAKSLVADAKKDISLANIETSIKSIEDQLSKINKNEQSISTQRVLKQLITTMLDLAEQAGIDSDPHRSKFIMFLQDTTYEFTQIKQG